MSKILLSLSLIYLISCSSKPTVEQVNVFNNKLSEMKVSSQKELKPSKESKIPLKEGQWVTMFSTLKENNYSSLSTFKILKITKNQVTMEIESYSVKTDDKSVIYYEVENYPTIKKLLLTKKEVEEMVDDLKILKVISKHGTAPAQEMPAVLLSMAKGQTKNLFASGYRIGEFKNSGCESPYFKSKKCLIADVEVNVLGTTYKSKSFVHSEIPVLSFIKHESEKGDTFVINFGLTGAKSAL